MRFAKSPCAIAVVCLALASSSAAAGDKVFPPDNIDNCTSGTALSWSPGNSVRCIPIVEPDQNGAMPVFATVQRLVGDNIMSIFLKGARQIFGSDDATYEHTASKCFPSGWASQAGLESVAGTEACLFSICQGIIGTYPLFVMTRGACAKGDPNQNCRKGGEPGTEALPAVLELSCLYTPGGSWSGTRGR